MTDGSSVPVSCQVCLALIILQITAHIEKQRILYFKHDKYTYSGFSFSWTQFLINNLLPEISVVPWKNCYRPKCLKLKKETMLNIIAFICIQYQNDKVRLVVESWLYSLYCDFFHVIHAHLKKRSRCYNNELNLRPYIREESSWPLWMTYLNYLLK